MLLFQDNKSSLLDLREVPFKLEKEIQQLFEKNLFQITGLELVKSEFSIQNQRIDTLAFDIENGAFVIIEYKRGHNYSVFDQGVAYLNTLLKYKADFVLEYNESLDKNLKKNEVDWSQSKIVFVSPAFNQMQKQAVDFKDLNIELWEVKRFENNIVVIDGVQKSQAAPSIKLTSTSENIQILSKGLKIFINVKKGDLEDPKNLTKDISELGHHGNGDYQIIVSDTKHLEYVMSLIKQGL